jgi:hypothetical protein
MDAITFALRRVVNSDIPDLILEDAFISKQSRMQRRPASMEDNIREKVIMRRVIPDLNILGGVSVDINLAGMPFELLTNFQRIYRIPFHLTQNREITQVINVTLNVTSNYGDMRPGSNTNNVYVTPIERAASRVVDSWRPIPNITNAQIEILGDNVLKINDFQNFSGDMTLRCLIKYSDELEELKKPYYGIFADLVVLATKAYIYKNLSLEIDMAKLSGGREFGRYKEFIDDYRDANEQYQTLLDEKAGKMLLLNDQNRKDRHILRSGHTRA